MSEFERIILPPEHLERVVKALRLRGQRVTGEGERLHREAEVMQAKADVYVSIGMDIDMDADRLERAARRAEEA